MITEYLVQMGPMWLTAGLAVGWLAYATWHARGYGLLTDMALGLVGAILAGAVVTTTAASNVGMLVMFAVGAAGAMVAIAAQRQLWRPTHVKPGAVPERGAMTAPVRGGC
jgi:uncharacterized membrane protein YeaQ/YmgE (transglycosylase-associated protein family)